MSLDPPFRQAAIVGGAGAVGRLVATLLREADVPVLVVDRQPADAGIDEHRIVADVTHPSPAAVSKLAACDLVVLATPEDVAIAATATLAPALDRATLLVDTLSVKSPFAAALARSPFTGECVGINPMFAPDLPLAGRGVIVTPHMPGPRVRTFTDLLARRGAVLGEMDADAHDRACAALQVATHAAVLGFAGALRASGYDPRQLEGFMPPPHRTLLALLGRLLAGEPAVYHDIQAANPHAAAMRQRLLDAQRELDRQVDAGPAAFARELESLRGMLAKSTVDYAALCARLFAVA